MTTTEPQPVAITDLGANVTKVTKLLMAVDGVDQQTLAEGTGIPTSVLSKTFSGVRRWQLEDMGKVANYFGVEVSALLQPARALVDVARTNVQPSGGMSELSDRRSRNRPVTGGLTRGEATFLQLAA